MMEVPGQGSCKHVFIEKDYHECEFCCKQFTTLFNLKRHKGGNCQEKVCTKCNLRFQKVSQLKTHTATCDGTAPHQCEFCSKSFVKNSNLMRHRQTHTEKCSKCGAVFYKRLPLMSVFAASLDFVCGHCKTNFQTRELLDKHLYQHLTEYQFKCEGCPISFDKKRQLLKHKMKCHPELVPQTKARKTYECSLCQKHFRLYRDLKLHLQTHMDQGEKVYHCNVCQKGYNRKVSLKWHMVKHNKLENKPRCEICRKVFSHPYSLRAHKRIHMNIRPHKCDKCDKSFRQLSHLMKHARTHARTATSSRHKKTSQLQCEVCHKSFNDAASLRVHRSTHRSQVKFKCVHCPKTFLHEKNLADHMNIHTGQQPYTCPVCNQGFALVGQLYRHHKLSHGELQLPNMHQQTAADTAMTQQNTQISTDSLALPTDSVQTASNMAPTFAYVDSIYLPIQMNMQQSGAGGPASVQGHVQSIQPSVQFQPVISTRPSFSEPIPIQQLQIPVQMPVQMKGGGSDAQKAPPAIAPASDMPTYWHLQQSSMVQYEQDLDACMPTHSMQQLQPAAINTSTIDVISNGMQQLDNMPLVSLANTMQSQHFQ